MYYFLAFINIAGGLFAIGMLLHVAINYIIAPRMSMYLFLTIVAMAYLVVSQTYTLTEPQGLTKLKIASIFWWGKTVYFAWALRFTSIKK